MSEFFFTLLTSKIPALRTHFIALGLPTSLRESASQLQRQSMIVRRLKVLPIESIVRGYITGSAWSSYRKNGTVCGIKLSDGLRESQQFEPPLWTPSTKAPAGEHDENISTEQGISRFLFPETNGKANDGSGQNRGSRHRCTGRAPIASNIPGRIRLCPLEGHNHCRYEV